MPEPTKPASGSLIVAMTEDGQNIVINHPDLEPDAEGCGHIVFSPDQATNLAMLLMQKVKAINGDICGHCGDPITQEGGWATALFRYCFKQECQEEFYKEAQAMVRAVDPATADRMTEATKTMADRSQRAIQTFATIYRNHFPQSERPLTDEGSLPAHFTCPKCGEVSYNPNDVKNRYCGACHEFAK